MYTISPSQNLTFQQLKTYYQGKGYKIKDSFIDNLDLRLSTGEYNYAAYLLADSNGASIKVVKYAGADKVNLVENDEFGYECLITAATRVMDRLDAENHMSAKVTPILRLEKNMVDKTALREAVINAIVHNDYTEGAPVVEIFSDRITVTSSGGLVEGLSQEDFFSCRSMPRNRELMRVFKDVELTEQLGVGMARILHSYDRSIFYLSPSFLAVTLPFEEGYESTDGTNGTNDTNHDTNHGTNDTNHGTNDTNHDTNDTNHGTNHDTNGTNHGTNHDTNGTNQIEFENSNAEVLLAAIKNDPTITMNKLSETTKLSRSTVARTLKAMQDAGMLKRIGATRGKWEI